MSSVIHRSVAMAVAHSWLTLLSQALGQCQLYLRNHYPSAIKQEADSTSAAALYASTHPEAVAICSKQAGVEFGLVLVDDCDGVGCQDVGEGNVTTFGVFAKRKL